MVMPVLLLLLMMMLLMWRGLPQVWELGVGCGAVLWLVWELLKAGEQLVVLYVQVLVGLV